MNARVASNRQGAPTLGGVSLHRPREVPGEPVGRLTGPQELRRSERSLVVALGTLACPSCDAPVAPHGPLTPAEGLACPVCAHGAAVRDFLSLAQPTRPAHVEVRVRP